MSLYEIKVEMYIVMVDVGRETNASAIYKSLGGSQHDVSLSREPFAWQILDGLLTIVFNFPPKVLLFLSPQIIVISV